MTFTESNTVEALVRDVLCGGVTHHTAAGPGLARRGGELSGVGWRHLAPRDLPRQAHEVLVEDQVREALVRLNPEIAARPDRADDVLHRLRAIVTGARADGLVKANEEFAVWLTGERSMPFGADGEHVIDLDTQISATFHAADAPNLEKADSRADDVAPVVQDAVRLGELEDGGDDDLAGVLRQQPLQVVLVDEAHRTQEGDLGRKMRRALPNAFLFGLTGTPINRADRNTFFALRRRRGRGSAPSASASRRCGGKHEQGLLVSVEFLKSLLDLARDVVEAERAVPPATPEERGKAALTELFEEARNDRTPVLVERVVADVDEIVRHVRFAGWQNTHAGQREVKQALRRTLLKYRLHQDQELLDRAYGYVRQYY